jgi:anti-sigma B factor antagonist
MELSVRNEKRLCIISVLSPRIDAPVAVRFKAAMRDALTGAPEQVVLDLSAVEFIDSSGLGAIVAVMKIMGDPQRMALAGFSPAVERVFHLTRMDTVFAIFPNLDAARDALDH